MKPNSRGPERRRGPRTGAIAPKPPPGFRLVSDESQGALRPVRRSNTGGAPDSGPVSQNQDQAVEEGVYIISVAARILAMHPQTLRKYERSGLITPSRTHGMLRLYSDEDIARLRLIKHLVGELGLNLAGVHLALGLFNQLMALSGRVDSLEGMALKTYLNERLKNIFELLHTRFPWQADEQ